MRNKINKIKQKISQKEVLLRFTIMVLTFILVYYSNTQEKHVINIVGFLITFFISIYLHKHFFPLTTLAISFYLVASLQEYMDISYINSVVTDTYWFIGNSFLIVSILKFAYNLKYEYKIVKQNVEKI